MTTCILAAFLALSPIFAQSTGNATVTAKGAPVCIPLRYADAPIIAMLFSNANCQGVPLRYYDLMMMSGGMGGFGGGGMGGFGNGGGWGGNGRGNGGMNNGMGNQGWGRGNQGWNRGGNGFGGGGFGTGGNGGGWGQGRFNR
jgi:hypothetical protein